MNVPIQLVSKVPVKGANGVWGTTHTKYNLWAETIKQSGTRIYLNGQDQLKDQMTFRIKFRPDINPTTEWKIIYLGRKHTITSVTRENEQRFNWIIQANSSGKV